MFDDLARVSTAAEEEVRIVPYIPQHGDIVTELLRLRNISDTVSRAVQYLAKGQLFIDGNKRLAQLVANKVPTAEGVGMLKISDTAVTQFAEALVDYYETGSDKLLNYLKGVCLQRVQFSGVVAFNGKPFTVSEVVNSIPPALCGGYASDEECAKALLSLI